MMPSLQEQINNHLTQNPNLLNIPQNKSIVAFLGYTGAGKSTLINYLIGKNLKCVDKYGKTHIELQNPQDSSSFLIGGTNVSQTHLPQYVEYQNECLFDFGGFNDSYGAERGIVNASFIKNIISNAQSLKIVIVIEIDSITVQRGTRFKLFLKQINQLFSNQSIIGSCAIVLTKVNSSISQYFDSFVRDLSEVPAELNAYANGIFKFSQPQNSTIQDQERTTIWNGIKQLSPIRITHLDISIMYTSEEQKEIKKVFQQEFDCILAKIEIEDHLESLNESNSEQQREKMLLYKQQFIDEVNHRASLILLRPLAEQEYMECLNNLQSQLDSLLSQMQIKINYFDNEKSKARFNDLNKQMEKVNTNLSLAQQANAQLTAQIQQINRRRKRPGCTIF